MLLPPSSAIIGHARVLQQLETDLVAQHVSHAYLLCGPPHIGKLTVARWFAEQLLLAVVPDDRREVVSRQLAHLTHPDLLILDELWVEDGPSWEVLARSSNAPQEHREKAGVKTDVIGIDDVRALQERMQATGELSRRVCIIAGVERMQAEAANALLKTLEEPPPGRVFILTSHGHEQLLPTIVSRCRVLHLAPASHRELLPLLERESEEERDLLLHIAQGAAGVLLRLRDDTDARVAERNVASAAQAFWTTRSLLDRLRALDPLLKRGPEADGLLRHLFLAVRALPPPQRVGAARALFDLTRDLETNAHRGLLCARFAQAIATP